MGDNNIRIKGTTGKLITTYHRPLSKPYTHPLFPKLQLLIFNRFRLCLVSLKLCLDTIIHSQALGQLQLSLSNCVIVIIIVFEKIMTIFIVIKIIIDKKIWHCIIIVTVIAIENIKVII